jgi:hypothetical protein
VAFLFLPFPAICLAGPLAGCLILTRPKSLREWSWILAAITVAALSYAASSSVAQQIFLAYGVAFTGAFLALRIWRPGPVLPRAAVAAIDTAVLIAIGAWAFGLEWAGIRAALETQFQDALRLVTSGSPVPAGQLDQLRETMRTMASVYPGVAILGAIGGGALGSALAWHISDGQSGLEPGRFSNFRFNDHLIWGAILTMALVLLPLRAPFGELVANALVVWVGYVARGAAVTGFAERTLAGATPLQSGPRRAPALTYALGGLLLGLADTWLDFRRVESPPTQERP